MRLTIEQARRIGVIVEQWNAIRQNDRRPATAEEVIDYLITQEEIGFEAMTGDDMREELQREDLADEKPLPPVVLTPIHLERRATFIDTAGVERRIGAFDAACRGEN